MVIADASGLPVAVHTDSANPHEVKLVQATVNEAVTVDDPEELSGIVPMTVTRLIRPVLIREVNSSRRIARITKNSRRKMGELCVDTEGDGKSNTFLRGSTNLKRQ